MWHDLNRTGDPPPQPPSESRQTETGTGQCDRIRARATSEGPLPGLSQTAPPGRVERKKQAIEDSTLLASWVQRQVARPVLRALDGNGLQQWGTAPSFDPILMVWSDYSPP